MDREWLPVIKTWKLNERHYGALQGMNKAETAENNVQIQLNVVTAKYNQYKNQIEALDSQIESYNSMRKQLTKEQLSGSSLSKNINRGASIAKLTEATQRFKRKAQAEVGERSEIENKIRPILK